MTNPNMANPMDTYLFEMADCDDPVLIHDAFDIVDRILFDAWPRFSKSPVLFCFFNFKPCKTFG